MERHLNSSLLHRSLERLATSPERFSRWAMADLWRARWVTAVLLLPLLTYVLASLPPRAHIALSLFVIAVAAAEVGVGLAMVLLLYRSSRTIDLTTVDRLRG